MTTTQDIVAKLWSLCHVLRDDGITYHEYVTELTYLLFLTNSGSAALLSPSGIPPHPLKDDTLPNP